MRAYAARVSEALDWVDALSALVARAPDAFVAGHVVLPTPDYFPEPWSPTRAGLTALARRLHAHLGLPLDAQIELDAEDETNALLVETRIELTAIGADLVHYRVSSLGRPDDAVFALLHEAARATELLGRAQAGHGPFRRPALEVPIEIDERPEAHEAASLLAVARGLGAMVAAGAHTYRQAGKTEGRMVRSEWQHAVYGALPPEIASELLAVQLVVRLDVDRDAVLSQLPSERAAEVRAALAKADHADVLTRLALAPEATWPAPATLPVPPIAETTRAEDDAPVGSAERRRKRAGRAGGSVYRVREASNLGLIKRALALAVVLCGGGYYLGELVSDGWGSIFAILGAGVAALSTLIRGTPPATSSSDTCSDPACAKTIPQDLARCPGCDRPIAGVALSQREATELRWAAEEAAEEEAAARRVKKKAKQKKARVKGAAPDDGGEGDTKRSERRRETPGPTGEG